MVEFGEGGPAWGAPEPESVRHRHSQNGRTADLPANTTHHLTDVVHVHVCPSRTGFSPQAIASPHCILSCAPLRVRVPFTSSPQAA